MPPLRLGDKTPLSRWLLSPAHVVAGLLRVLADLGSSCSSRGADPGALPLSQHTHYPQFASRDFAGRTRRGPFGDALAEFDDSVGQLVQALQDNGLENSTLLFFTSDNGSGGCECRGGPGTGRWGGSARCHPGVLL